MKHRAKVQVTFLIMVGIFLITTMEAVAASIGGIMTINPGVMEKIQATDPATGELLFRDNGNPIMIGPVYTGGSWFSMQGSASTGIMLSPGATGGILLGTYQNFVLDPDEPHIQGWKGDIDGDGILDGAAGTGYSGTVVSEGNILMPFGYFGSPTYVGTNPLSYQGGTSQSAPTAQVDDWGNLSVDLSSWEVMWNGSAFQQGPRNGGPFVPATGTYDPVTGAYELDWQSRIVGGPFSNVLGTWHLEGIISPVPVPGAVWLLGSGLAGLLGLRRKK